MPAYAHTREIDSDELSRQSFHDRCQHFIRKWSPGGNASRADFAADLMTLMRDLHVEAKL